MRVDFANSQGVESGAFIGTCQALCSRGTQCLIAVEQRNAEAYESFITDARSAFKKVRLLLTCVCVVVQHGAKIFTIVCGCARRLQLFH